MTCLLPITFYCQALEFKGTTPAGQNASRSTAFRAEKTTRSEGATLLKPSQSEDGQAGCPLRTSDRGPAMSSTKDERPTTIAATTLTLRPVSNPPQILQSVYVRLGAPPSGAECQHDDWTGTRPRVMAVVGVSSSSAPCLYCKRAAWTRSLVSSYS